jgi:hypothetical protein
MNLSRSGISGTVAMAITGHKTGSVFARYDITSQDDMRRAAERLHAHLAEQLETDSLDVDGAPISTLGMPRRGAMAG